MTPTLDVYPANVSGIGQRLNKGRVIVADGRLYVFDRNRTLVATASEVTTEAQRGHVWAITAGEDTYEVTRTSYGCGCNRKAAVYTTSAEQMLALVDA